MLGPFTFASRRWPSSGQRRWTRAQEEAYCRRELEEQARASAKTTGMGCDE